MPVRGETDRRYQVTVCRDVRIPTGERGVTLSGDLFLPMTSRPVPLLLTVLPYRRDVTALSGSATERWFAGRGYASLLLDIRGTGSSDGIPRAPFDPAEADDALAAIEWAVRQPWCDGTVGMWGGSYGALMTLRTASRRPPALRAIIAIEGLTDPGPDFVHPGGSRGALALDSWVLGMIFGQLLPPLDDYADPAEQVRWRRRLSTAPHLFDLYRHGPGDPVWEARRIDVSSVDVPALCVAGWRDLFVDGMIRAYAELRGPKRLIAGPWMHVMPQECPFHPIDFLNLALSWWDRWLTGTPGATDTAPPVSVYIQGERPRWLGFREWPPDEANGTTTDLTDLSAWRRDEPEMPDLAVGPQSGLWAIPAGAFGLPLDQHDDDTGSLCLTSPPLHEPLLISGRPRVTLAAAWPRGSVKLTDVDEFGRSTMISAGLWSGGSGTVTVPLTPTGYEIPAGHRMRVVVAPADFPRVWPVLPPEDDPWPSPVGLSLPVVAEADATPVDYPPPDVDETEEPLAEPVRPVWEIADELLGETVSVRLAATDATQPGRNTHGRRHVVEVEQTLVATAHRADPDAATVNGGITASIDVETGRHITVEVGLTTTASGVDATGRVTLDGSVLLDRRWRD